MNACGDSQSQERGLLKNILNKVLFSEDEGCDPLFKGLKIIIFFARWPKKLHLSHLSWSLDKILQ